MKKHIRLILFFMMMLAGLACISLAQTATNAGPGEAKSEAKMERKRTLWDTIVIGGWAMWPLGLCSFGVVGFTVLNFQRISRKQMIPEAVVAQIKTAAQAGNYEQMLNTAAASDSFFARILAAGLSKIRPADPEGSKPQVEAAISETAGHEEAKYSFWVNFLSLITGMAPMFGLMGTISGMIGAFDKLGAGGMGKPELLATNIGEALITTAAGLMIAVPSMASYFVFKSMLALIMKDAEHQITGVLDELMENIDAPAAESN